MPLFAVLLPLLMCSLTLAWAIQLPAESNTYNKSLNPNKNSKRTTNSWQIEFFSGPNCEHDPNFTRSTHFGTGIPSSGWCLQPGQPTSEGGEDGSCRWFTHWDGESRHWPCTTPTRPWPLSYRFREGTDCCVGVTDSDCDTVSCYTQDQAGKCLKTADLVRVGDDGYGEMKMIFQCYDHMD